MTDIKIIKDIPVIVMKSFVDEILEMFNKTKDKKDEKKIEG